MKKLYAITVILLNLLFLNVSASQFGEYNYSKYLGLQQQIQTQKMIAQRQKMRNRYVPASNVRYPNAYNKYPNIQKDSYYLTGKQRYSMNYYKHY